MRNNSVILPGSQKDQRQFVTAFYIVIAVLVALLGFAAVSPFSNSIILTSGVIFLIAVLAAYLYTQKKNYTVQAPVRAVVVLLITGIFLRLILAAFIYGYKTDIGCFVGWSDSAFRGGLDHFYTSGQFADYPPLYMYVLYFLGALKSLFNIAPVVFLIKMPAIFLDVVTALFLYRIARDKLNPTQSVFVFASVILNPAVMMNSAVWGQIDIIYTLMLAICVYLLIQKKLSLAIIIFVLALLLKIQSVLLAPAILFAVISGLSNKETRKHTLTHLLAGTGIAVALGVLLIMPFGGGRPITWIFELYTNSLGVYHYVTVNGFNLYGAFGLNWVQITNTFLGLSYVFWGAVAVVAVFGYSIWLYRLYPEKENLFNITAFIVLGVYMFSTNMHERYSFAAPVLLLFSYCFIRDRRIFFASLFTSGTVLANQVIGFQYDGGQWIPYPVMLTLSLINLLAFAYSATIITKIAVEHRKIMKKGKVANENE